MTRDVFIYDAIRTPRGTAGPTGPLANVRSVELISGLMRELVARNQFDTSAVNDVVLGCNTQVGDQGANISKIAASYAGWDSSCGGSTVNRFCASGLDAITTAAAKIGVGYADLVVAGGVESMSRVPIFSDNGAWFADPDVAERTGFLHMGIAADILATRHKITRDDTDRYALSSQQRAAAAWDSGLYDDIVMPVRDRSGAVSLAKDSCMRTTSQERLAAFGPAFEKFTTPDLRARIAATYPTMGPIEHVHTVASSPAICDGASLVLLGSAHAGEANGLRPRARIAGAVELGSDPVEMLGGPAEAIRRVLTQVGLQVKDLDVIECNESFAATPLRAQRSLDCDPAIMNPNGGAIALGHPLGATGGILLAAALRELERMQGRYAAVAIPAGAGIASAVILEKG